VVEPTGFLAYIIAGREARCKTIASKCLLQYYCSNACKDGTFFKSTLDICIDTRISERTVRRFNDGLKGFGVLTWVEGDSFRHLANAYTLHLPKLKEFAVASKKQHEAAKDKARELSAERSRRYREKKAASR
jgi:hypothetical protein